MAYNQKINSRDKDTPGTFREDQENKYTNSEGNPTKEKKYKSKHHISRKEKLSNT